MVARAACHIRPEYWPACCSATNDRMLSICFSNGRIAAGRMLLRSATVPASTPRATISPASPSLAIFPAAIGVHVVGSRTAVAARFTHGFSE